eukprot:scaffold133566_cov75-Phaeocystis_antarctica.AAC.1
MPMQHLRQLERGPVLRGRDVGGGGGGDLSGLDGRTWDVLALLLVVRSHTGLVTVERVVEPDHCAARKASSYQESCQAGQEFGFYHFRVELKLTDVNVTECVTGSSPPRYLDIVRPECVPVHEERPHAAQRAACVGAVGGG